MIGYTFHQPIKTHVIPQQALTCLGLLISAQELPNNAQDFAELSYRVPKLFFHSKVNFSCTLVSDNFFLNHFRFLKGEIMSSISLVIIKNRQLL